MADMWVIQIYALKAHIHYTLPIEISTIPFHFIIDYIAGERCWQSMKSSGVSRILIWTLKCIFLWENICTPWMRLMPSLWELYAEPLQYHSQKHTVTKGGGSLFITDQPFIHSHLMLSVSCRATDCRAILFPLPIQKDHCWTSLKPTSSSSYLDSSFSSGLNVRGTM